MTHDAPIARVRGYCSCGSVLHGNGGWASHVAMHRRRGQWNSRASVRAQDPTQFGALTRDQYLAQFPDRDAHGLRRLRTPTPLAPPVEVALASPVSSSFTDVGATATALWGSLPGDLERLAQQCCDEFHGEGGAFGDFADDRDRDRWRGFATFLWALGARPGSPP